MKKEEKVMTIEELSELTDMNASPEGEEPVTPLAEGKRFRPVAFEMTDLLRHIELVNNNA